MLIVEVSKTRQKGRSGHIRRRGLSIEIENSSLLHTMTSLFWASWRVKHEILTFRKSSMAAVLFSRFARNANVKFNNDILSKGSVLTNNLKFLEHGYTHFTHS